MTETDSYLSRLDVQQALHVAPAVQGLKWSECNMDVNGRFVSDGGSMNAVYRDIFAQKPSLSVLVYSGDVDILTVAYGKTQYCLDRLAQSTGQTKQRQWGPWYINGYTAGYWESFNNFTFATIKGAGHEAMQYQPVSAQQMAQRWVATQSLADPSSRRAFMSPPPMRRVRQGDALRMFEARTKQRK